MSKKKRLDALYCNSACKMAYTRNRSVTGNAEEKTILSLCDHSGAWSKPYADVGYRVMRIDIKNGQDVRLLKHPGPVYGLLAAPPCTHLARCGQMHWKKKGAAALLEALAVVDACLRYVVVCNPTFWALENPLGRLTDHLGAPDFYYQPYEYGDAYSKRTCLWGRFNRPKPTQVVEPIKGVAHSIDAWNKARGEKGSRGELRSITPAGFASAFFSANR